MRYFYIVLLWASISSCHFTYQVVHPHAEQNGTARLVIFRRGISGFLKPIKIYADDQLLGQLGPNRYLDISSLKPKSYHIYVRNYRYNSNSADVKLEQNKTTVLVFKLNSAKFLTPSIKATTDTSFLRKHKKPHVRPYQEIN